MIYSDTSVMTFDGEHVTIPPYKSQSCSYLLTHEYVNNSFTITSRQNSIFVRVRNGDNIVLENTGIVYINGKMVELPQQMQDFNITRVVPFVYIDTSSGLNIRCDMDHNLCLFNVPSWYHNRVVGLLGNMDGEKSNDWRGMKKNFVPSAITLADSWEVSGSSKCLHTPFVQDTNSNQFDTSSDNQHDTMMISIRPKKIANNKCSEMNYNKDNKHCMKLDREYESQLSRCFNVIDPTDFRDVCLHEICGKKCSDNQCGCNIFAAYIQRCEKAGINISMPRECCK